MTEDEIKELIRSTIQELSGEIEEEVSNSTQNVAGFDTKVWGTAKRKYSLLDLDDGDEEDE
jgi:hypothetical protein